MTLTPDNFKAEMVAKANVLRQTLTGDFAQVQSIVEANDLVIAVWQDTSAPDGIGTYIVKGRRVLMDVVANETPKVLAWTAIPCISLEQAIALQQVCGEPELS